MAPRRARIAAPCRQCVLRYVCCQDSIHSAYDGIERPSSIGGRRSYMVWRWRKGRGEEGYGVAQMWLKDAIVWECGVWAHVA